MDLKESLKHITHLATRLAPDGWEAVNSYNFLHYNEMTFIPDLKKNKANRRLTNVSTIKDTIAKLAGYVDTIISTDVSSLTSEFDVDLYASKVTPDSFEKNHIMLMTDLQDEVNSAWVNFYASVMSGSSHFEDDVSEKFVSQMNITILKTLKKRLKYTRKVITRQQLNQKLSRYVKICL